MGKTKGWKEMTRLRVERMHLWRAPLTSPPLTMMEWKKSRGPEERRTMLQGSEGVSHGLSMWALFLQADWVVKGVILVLVMASLWSWAIMFSKARLLQKRNATAEAVTSSFHESMLDGVEVRGDRDCPFIHLLSMASREWRKLRSMPLEARSLGLQRLEQLMSVYVDQTSSGMATQLPILGSMGSSAPFIALFGTVWGIMNSFQSIAVSKNTSLAVVAPGIAEALFATAIGFLVAIPAVLGYNKLTSSMHTYSERLGNFAQELLAGCMRV